MEIYTIYIFVMFIIYCCQYGLTVFILEEIIDTNENIDNTNHNKTIVYASLITSGVLILIFIIELIFLFFTENTTTIITETKNELKEQTYKKFKICIIIISIIGEILLIILLILNLQHNNNKKLNSPFRILIYIFKGLSVIGQMIRFAV